MYQICDWSSKRWPRYSCQASTQLFNHRYAADVFFCHKYLQGPPHRPNTIFGRAALKLNASKTKAIICGYREFVQRIPHDLPRIEVSGIPVPYVKTAENLGVTPGWSSGEKSQPRTLQLKFFSPFYYSRIAQTACLRPSPLSPWLLLNRLFKYFCWSEG